MFELKEGNYAVIVSGEDNDLNVGKIVYLWKHLGNIETEQKTYDDCWVINCTVGVMTRCGKEKKIAGIEANRLIAINPNQLKGDA